MLNDFTGGGQIFLHKLRMFFQVLHRSFMTSLLVSLALRPTLMILGFIASIVLVQIFGMFVNYLFVIGFDISMSGNNTTSSSWLSTVAAYMIYTIFMAVVSIYTYYDATKKKDQDMMVYAAFFSGTVIALTIACSHM